MNPNNSNFLSKLEENEVEKLSGFSKESFENSCEAYVAFNNAECMGVNFIGAMALSFVVALVTVKKEGPTCDGTTIVIAVSLAEIT